MKPPTLALTAAVALWLTAGAHELPAMTAGDLAQLCNGSDHVSRNACRIYILGVTQGIVVGMRIAGSKSPTSRWCVPPGITAEELEASVKKKLATLDADSQQRDAAGLIGVALAQGFPCGAGRRREPSVGESSR